MTQEITNTVQRFFACVDGRDWDGARALMTAPFHLDYSSFGAGPGADIDPGDILNGWKAMLPGFDATQHHLGALDIVVEGEFATVKTTVIATHYIADAEGGALWTVHGSYVLKLVRDDAWRLSANTFNFAFVTGNTALPALAQERAS